jgi:hypothetical protein
VVGESSWIRREEEAMAEVPRWRLTGDWFDVCRCRVPCGCSIAQAPNEGQCDGILAWHVREGRYGDVTLDGLNIVAVGSFEGSIWAGEAKPSMGFFIDERADEPARVQVHNAPEAEVGPGQVAFGPPPISERRKGRRRQRTAHRPVVDVLAGTVRDVQVAAP